MLIDTKLEIATNSQPLNLRSLFSACDAKSDVNNFSKICEFALAEPRFMLIIPA